MTKLEQEFLKLESAFPFGSFNYGLTECGNLNTEELKQLNEIWDFVNSGEFWKDSSLTTCCQLAGKALEEKYNLSNEFNVKMINAAAHLWK